MSRHALYQREEIIREHTDMFRAQYEAAEKDGRVVVRKGRDGAEVHSELSEILKCFELEPLNNNLPPVTENSFLKTAIERVNNKMADLVWVIADYGSGSH